MTSPLGKLPPRPRAGNLPAYPRLIAAGVVAAIGGLTGCGGPPPNMGGVIAVPYQPAASSSVLVPVPHASSSAPQPATPDPPLAGEPPAPFEQGQ